MAELVVPSPEEVQHHLIRFLTPDTQIIANASVWLRDYLRQPYSIPTMFQIMLQSQDVRCRQTAGVLLRSWLVKHWAHIDEDISINMKAALLEAFSVEPLPILRKTQMELIALIARVTLPADHWPEFWPFMIQMSGTGDAVHKASVLDVIAELGDHLFKQMIPMMADFINFFTDSLSSEQDPTVRFAAFKAAAVLATEIDEESDPLVAHFQALIPMMTDFISYCVSVFADLEANECLTNLQAMVESCPYILAPHVSGIAQLCLLTASNRENEWELRSECLTLIEWIIQFRPSFITNQGLLDPIITVMAEVAAEPTEPNTPAWQITPHRFALQVCDCIARFINPKYTFDALMERVNGWVGSSDPWQRRAAYGILSAMPNGCVEQMLPNIPELLEYLKSSLNDEHPFVRQSGCIMLGQFADYLCPDLLDHHEVILSLVYRAMMEDDPEIQDRALYSLITFMESLDRFELADLLDQIMTRLVQLLGHSSKDIQEMALEAITAVASASLEKFMPYWQHMVEMLGQMMDITAPDMLSLRGLALDCAGVIAMAVGRDAFGPHFDFFMHKALEGYNLPQASESELQTLTVNFFANVAEALQQDFAPYLDTCLEIVLESLQNTDGAQPEMTDDQKKLAMLMMDDDEEDDHHRHSQANIHEEEEPEEEKDRLLEELEGLKYIPNQGLISEKTNALQALGTFASAMGAAFVPHIDRCLQIVSVVATYVHPKVRSFAIFPMEAFQVCINQAFPSPNPWQQGQPPEEHPLHETAQQFIDGMMSTVIMRIEKDFDLGVQSRYLRSIKNILAALGAPAIHNHLPAIMNALLRVFHMETTAQVMETDERDATNQEFAQEMLAAFEDACDLLSAISKAYGPEFVMWFGVLEGLLQHVNTGTQSDEHEGLEDDGSEVWREVSLAALAQIVENVVVQNFPPENVTILLAAAIKGLTDGHTSARTNSIYLTRVLITHEQTYPFWGKILELLIPFLHVDDDMLIDNTLGCIAAMIRHNSSALPMAELLPEWIAAFPLRTDRIEADIAYGVLCELLQSSNQDIFPLIPDAFRILIDAIGSIVPSDECKVNIGHIIQNIWGQFSTELGVVIDSLDQDQLANFKSLMASQGS